ncbi:CsbD family protein [Pseudonocardia phyllosphaerae]|uniref:CsbD family protein n=1 Tax=Pseudonocardia phyllosphaerae TaxID=3390502 RepID=UPI00397A3FE5
MGNDDKINHKAQELQGKAKEAVGNVTDDEYLQAEGKSDQAKGNAKQVGDKLKDAVEDFKNK